MARSAASFSVFTEHGEPRLFCYGSLPILLLYWLSQFCSVLCVFLKLLLPSSFGGLCPLLTSQCSPRLHPYALWLFPPWMLEAIFILNSSCYAYVCKWGLASDLFPLELRVCVFKCFLISVSSRDPQMQCVHSWVSLPLLFPLPFLYHQSPNAAYCLPKWFLYLFFQRFIVLFLFGAADTCSIIGVH